MFDWKTLVRAQATCNVSLVQHAPSRQLRRSAPLCSMVSEYLAMLWKRMSVSVLCGTGNV